MNDEKAKVSVNRDTKREIDLLAAHEQRPVYVVVEEMVEIYKSSKTGKKGPVDVTEVINYRAKVSKLPRPKNAKSPAVTLVELTPA